MPKLRTWFGFLVAVVILTSCAQAPTAAPATQPEPQPIPTETKPAPTATDAPAVDYCLECHTDKEQLIDTAKPEVVLESESEGVG
jgi:hypothetical protein